MGGVILIQASTHIQTASSQNLTKAEKPTIIRSYNEINKPMKTHSLHLWRTWAIRRKRMEVGGWGVLRVWPWVPSRRKEGSRKKVLQPPFVPPTPNWYLCLGSCWSLGCLWGPECGLSLQDCQLISATCAQQSCAQQSLTFQKRLEQGPWRWLWTPEGQEWTTKPQSDTRPCLFSIMKQLFTVLSHCLKHGRLQHTPPLLSLWPSASVWND